MQRAPAVGVDDPVEDEGEEEEGYEVQDFVVDVGAELEAGEAGVRGGEEEAEEDRCEVSACVGLK